MRILNFRGGGSALRTEIDLDHSLCEYLHVHHWYPAPDHTAFSRQKYINATYRDAKGLGPAVAAKSAECFPPHCPSLFALQ